MASNSIFNVSRSTILELFCRVQNILVKPLMILSWLVCDMLRQILYAICFSHPIHSPITHNSFYTHRCCSTEGPLHRDLFTIKRLYTKKLWRTVKDPFPQKALQREAVTRSSFYTQTLLRTGAFRHRSFYTQNLLHREAVAQNKFRHTFGRPTRTISAERLPKPP